MNTSVSISHSDIAAQVKAAVALNTLMHPDLASPPLLTAGTSAMDTAIEGTLRNVASALGKAVVGITQADGRTVLETDGYFPRLRFLAEQMAVAEVLALCYTGTTACARYAESAQQLSQQITELMNVSQMPRIRSWPN